MPLPQLSRLLIIVTLLPADLSFLERLMPLRGICNDKKYEAVKLSSEHISEMLGTEPVEPGGSQMSPGLYMLITIEAEKDEEIQRIQAECRRHKNVHFTKTQDEAVRWRRVLEPVLNPKPPSLLERQKEFQK